MLGCVLSVLGTVPVLVGADFNAKSPVWCSSYTDVIGRLVKEFLVAYGLNILNMPVYPVTFSSASSQSVVGATFVSNSFIFQR